MKVLHIINNLDTGGTETVLLNLLASSDAKRYQATVVSLMGKGNVGRRMESLGVKVYAFGLKNGRPRLKALQRLWNVARLLQPDLIQGWMYYGNLVALLAGKLSPGAAPVFWNVRHTPYELHAEKWSTAGVIRLGARLSRRPGKIVYNSEASAKVHEALGYAAGSRVVIPNGFDLNRFAPSPEYRALVRSELGISQDALLIGLIGNFRPEKDHHNFMEAAGQFAIGRPNVHFVMAGYRIDSNNSVLAELANRHGILARTHLLGHRNDVSRITAALDIASSSSSSEAFPNVIGEAMACGILCAATDVGDSARIVGDAGIIVPPRDPRALAQAWRQFLNLDPADQARRKLLARERVRDLFSLSAMVRAYEHLYEEFQPTNGAVTDTEALNLWRSRKLERHETH